MPKRKYNNSKTSTKTRSSLTSTTDPEQKNNICDVTNIASHSNEEDFLENVAITMNKRKKHLEKFYDRTNEASG
jgi:hypothetical protein